MKICIVTGGTGGHIYPAVSLAHALKDQDPRVELFFVGNNDRMEATEIPALGFDFIGLPAKGFNGSIFAKVSALVALFKSKTLAKQLLKERKPDIVIGFGGYVCVPVMQAAHSLHIKTMLHEQNSIVGKANKVLMGSVDAIVCAYESNFSIFPKHKTRLLGNPRTYEIKKHHTEIDCVKTYGFNKQYPTILIVMGSLGSESVNAILPEALMRFSEAKIQVIYVTGKKHYEDFIQKVPVMKHIVITPYVDQLALMSQIDLIICRGGATTAAELAVFGMPSIIIPSPYVPNNHQYHNAKALFDAHASELIEEKDLNAQSLFLRAQGLINNPQRLEKMHTNGLKLAKGDAAEDMIQWILELVHGQ
jgi:UDP-N-acetylglucosamine--N-acetylmuramyl-(pentapeptide) pyrophosphoryl-undecaprenol N-acetylglucosamine transferase